MKNVTYNEHTLILKKKIYLKKKNIRMNGKQTLSVLGEGREMHLTLPSVTCLCIRISRNARPVLCLMFSRLCRRYLKNWLYTFWNHSTDLPHHVKICNPKDPRGGWTNVLSPPDLIDN